MNAPVLMSPDMPKDPHVIPDRRRLGRAPTAMLLTALLAILIELSPAGGTWRPIATEQTGRLLLVAGLLMLTVATWSCHLICPIVGRLNVMLAVTLVVAVIPHPLLWALRAAPTTGMALFVVLVLSALAGCLLDGALAELQLSIEDRGAHGIDWMRGLLVAALSVIVPAALLYWSPLVWWQAPILYTTCLSLVTAIAVVADDAPV